MKPLLLTLVIAAAATPALAYCPAIPDDASSHYIANQTALMLCQQRELADATAQRARELKFQSDLLSLQIQLDQQLKFQQQLSVTVPAVTFPSI